MRLSLALSSFLLLRRRGLCPLLPARRRSCADPTCSAPRPTRPCCAGAPMSRPIPGPVGERWRGPTIRRRARPRWSPSMSWRSPGSRRRRSTSTPSARRRRCSPAAIATHRFRTAAVAGDPDALHLWVIGDCGATSLPLCGGSGVEQRRAGARRLCVLDERRDARSLADARRQRLLLGDRRRVPDGGVRRLSAGARDGRPLAGVRQPRRGVVGFGDRRPGPTSRCSRCRAAAEAGGVASATEAYFSYESGDLHVVQLDSAESDLTPGSPMLTWLAADLAANTRPWTIVAFHHPPYTKGTHDSDNPADSGGIMQRMRENVRADPRGARRRPGAHRSQPRLRAQLPDRRPLRHDRHLRCRRRC